MDPPTKEQLYRAGDQAKVSLHGGRIQKEKASLRERLGTTVRNPKTVKRASPANRRPDGDWEVCTKTNPREGSFS